MKQNLLIMVAVAVLAAAGGYVVAMMLSADRAPRGVAFDHEGRNGAIVRSPEDLLGQQRPDFSHIDINGVPVNAADFDGQVLLVNFWATWCKPCVEEMPLLSELSQRFASRGLRIVGIALDDASRATEFANSLSVNYPVLVGQTDVVLTGRRYGNTTGMLPFTVLVDSDGIIRWTRLGALEAETLERQIKSLF